MVLSFITSISNRALVATTLHVKHNLLIFHKRTSSWRCHLLSGRSYCSFWSNVRRMTNLTSDLISIAVQIVDDLSRLCWEILRTMSGWCHISFSIHDPAVELFKGFSRHHCVLSIISFGLSIGLSFSWGGFTHVNLRMSNFRLHQLLRHWLLWWIINSLNWRFWY